MAADGARRNQILVASGSPVSVPTVSVPITPTESDETGSVTAARSVTAAHDTNQAAAFADEAENVTSSEELEPPASFADAGLLDLLDPDLFEEPDGAEDEPANESSSSADAAPSLADLDATLRRDVLPRLRGVVERRGYLTLGYLAHAVGALHRSDMHLAQVRAFVIRTAVPVYASRAHRGARNLAIEHIRHAQELFGDLITAMPPEKQVIERLGYSGLPLSEGTRLFLVQAWNCHCLSRAEEQRHARMVSDEIQHVGPDVHNWSAVALASREALILDNLWLVARIARKYHGRGLDIDDLIQEGAGALAHAVEKNDPSLQLRFMTYASSWIWQRIMRALADQARAVRLPVYVVETVNTIERTRARLTQELQHDPTIADVSAELGMPPGRVAELQTLHRPVLSLDMPADADETCHLSDFVVAKTHDLPELLSEHNDLRMLLDTALRALPDHERMVLIYRFGLDGGRERTLEEVSREGGLGVTRERIRQIESKALKKLRHPRQLQAFRAFHGAPDIGDPCCLPRFGYEALEEALLWLKGDSPAELQDEISERRSGWASPIPTQRIACPNEQSDARIVEQAARQSLTRYFSKLNMSLPTAFMCRIGLTADCALNLRDCAGTLGVSLGVLRLAEHQLFASFQGTDDVQRYIVRTLTEADRHPPIWLQFPEAYPVTPEGIHDIAGLIAYDEQQPRSLPRSPAASSMLQTSDSSPAAAHPVTSQQQDNDPERPSPILAESDDLPVATLTLAAATSLPSLVKAPKLSMGLRTVIQLQLRAFSPDDRYILAARFGLGGAAPLALQQAADRFWVPADYVRKLEGDLGRQLFFERARRAMFAFLADVDRVGGA